MRGAFIYKDDRYKDCRCGNCGAVALGRHMSGQLLLFMFILMVSFGMSGAEALVPEDIPSPNEGNPTNYIFDPYQYLSPAATREVNEIADKLREKTTCELAVALVKTTGDMPINYYSYRLFKHWGIGKADKNNGVLLLMAVEDRKVHIEVGSGAEGVLTDVSCGNIIRNDIVPPMKSGRNVSQAINAAVISIYKAMTDPKVAEELRSEQGGTARGALKTISPDTIWELLGWVAVLVFLFTAGLFISDCIRAHKRDKYRRAMIWRGHRPTYIWSILLSGGTTIIFAALAFLLYRRARDKKEICPTCGAKMKKLSEKEDNLLLNASQDFEEKLGTVDYDVWECPECGTVERFPYVEKQLKYKECPYCHTIAMNLVVDKVIKEPTTRAAGIGSRVYQCQFCQKIKNESYVIPKKADPTAAIVAGAAIGSAMRGGGGGGFGGNHGGFGGGMSSGGGATGGW